MNCRQIEELLLLALDEPLGTSDQATVDAHLVACPSCVESMRSYVKMLALVREVGRADEERAAPPLSETLVRRILDARIADRDATNARRMA